MLLNESLQFLAGVFSDPEENLDRLQQKIGYLSSAVYDYIMAWHGADEML